MLNQNLQFLKLGGSLITDKDRTEVVKKDLLQRILKQILTSKSQNSHLSLILGHGSGSFGHHAAKVYNTHQGVKTAEEWLGYQQVWQSARKLNQIVVEEAHKINLPLISFPPSAAVVASNHVIQTWDFTPIQASLDAGLIPIVYGDVVTDQTIGGTILSTEELFFHLALKLNPSKILLAGNEEGVYQDFPHNLSVFTSISKDQDLGLTLQGSQSMDVTGGMRSKVQLMQSLCRELEGLQVYIFSGENPINIKNALLGSHLGTLIH